jgi:hypothetical protein
MYRENMNRIVEILEDAKDQVDAEYLNHCEKKVAKRMAKQIGTLHRDGISTDNNAAFATYESAYDSGPFLDGPASRKSGPTDASPSVWPSETGGFPSLPADPKMIYLKKNQLFRTNSQFQDLAMSTVSIARAGSFEGRLVDREGNALEVKPVRVKINREIDSYEARIAALIDRIDTMMPKYEQIELDYEFDLTKVPFSLCSFGVLSNKEQTSIDPSLCLFAYFFLFNLGFSAN